MKNHFNFGNFRNVSSPIWIEYYKQILKLWDELKKIYTATATSQRVKGNYKDICIKDINDESGNVKIVGKIFKAETRVSRKGKMIANFYIYDKTYSIEVIAFENNRNFKREILEQFAKDMPSVEIKGFVSRSQYNNELQLKADFIGI